MAKSTGLRHVGGSGPKAKGARNQKLASQRCPQRYPCRGRNRGSRRARGEQLPPGMKRGLLWIASAPMLALIGLYKYVLSPLTPPSCRHYPSCSTYGLGSLQHHGLVRGGPLTLWRILRCHPWAAGGIDDVKTGPSWIAIGKLGFVSSKSYKKKR